MFVCAIFAAFLFVCGPTGCDRSAPQGTSQMTTEEIIRQHAHTPVVESIVPVATSLAGRSVFVATDSTTGTQPTTMTLDRLRFRTAQDNEGRMWAYAYTTQEELLRSFPQGTPYIELVFKDFFAIIEQDNQFAGIFLNSGSDASYPILRETFHTVKELLQQSAGR